MTVSYAFSQPSRVSPETRERVMASARELGYQRPSPVARSLRSGRTDQIGVVVPEHLSYAFDDPQAARFFAGVADVCVERGLGMVLIPTHGASRSDRASSDVDRVLSAAVDAYVLWTTYSGDPVLEAVASSGRPAAIQGGPEVAGIITVTGDDRAAAYAVAAAALATRERSRGGHVPVVLSFPVDGDRSPWLGVGGDLTPDVPYPVTARRLEGYRDALAAHGFGWDQVAVAVTTTNLRDEGTRNTAAVLDRIAPDAPLLVLAMSDELALGARDALASLQREAIITGWDASEEAVAAGIISVENPLREQGRRCAEAALGLKQPTRPVSWRVVQRPGDPAAD